MGYPGENSVTFVLVAITSVEILLGRMDQERLGPGYDNFIIYWNKLNIYSYSDNTNWFSNQSII